MNTENTNSVRTKYLLNLISRFENMKKGIAENDMLWKNFNITPEAIEQHIHEIYLAGSEIENLKQQLSKKLSEARELKEKEKKVLELLEKRAAGVHADEEEKLQQYGIEKRKRSM